MKQLKNKCLVFENELEFDELNVEMKSLIYSVIEDNWKQLNEVKFPKIVELMQFLNRVEEK